MALRNALVRARPVGCVWQPAIDGLVFEWQHKNRFSAIIFGVPLFLEANAFIMLQHRTEGRLDIDGSPIRRPRRGKMGEHSAFIGYPFNNTMFRFSKISSCWRKIPIVFRFIPVYFQRGNSRAVILFLNNSWDCQENRFYALQAVWCLQHTRSS